jgi:hypothetical protein
MLVMCIFSYKLAPLPLPGALNFWKPVQWLQFPDPVVTQVRSLINERPSVSVQANVGAHFSQHQQVYRYPYKVGDVDTIVLWIDSPTSYIFPHDKEAIGTIAHHLQMKPSEYLSSIECLLRDPGYGVVLWKEPWLVVSKGPKVVNVETLIRNRLEMLRHSWQINSEEYESARQECNYK